MVDVISYQFCVKQVISRSVLSGLFFSVAVMKSWQMFHKKGNICFGSQVEGIVHRGRKGMTSGARGSWSCYICGQGWGGVGPLLNHFFFSFYTVQDSSLGNGTAHLYGVSSSVNLIKRIVICTGLSPSRVLMAYVLVSYNLLKTREQKKRVPMQSIQNLECLLWQRNLAIFC